ncbi:MAG TPA: hypothetical protein VNN07_11995, partial [Candidatus Tectomicrobia bacterium]|nr:hypothetical protein [Candidatus Tectomicrobia bacterium]
MALLLLLAASLVGAAPVAGSDARADIPAVLDEAERAVAAIEGRYVRIRWADRLVDARIAAGDFDGAVRAAHHMPADADEHQQALGRAWGARYVAGDAAAVMRLAQPLRLYALADAARRHVEQRR